jgi:hypothetical protein
MSETTTAPASGTTAPATGTETATSPAPGTEQVEAKSDVQDTEGTILGEKETTKGDEKDAPEGDQAKASTVKPEDIEIKLPDGVTLDEALLGKFKPLAAELGLKSEQAQKFVDLALEMQQKQSASMTEAWNEQKQAWFKEVKADKELGGKNFESTVKLARQTIAKFGGPALGKELVALGIDNHPAIVRFCAAVGKAMGEDSIVGATAGATGSTDPQQAILREQYPTMFKDKE